MNHQEAKSILLLYRPGTADEQDPQIAEALAFAKNHPELSLWLEMHCARCEALRAKFQQIAPPAGLMEQILSEHAAARRNAPPRRTATFALVALLLLLLGVFAFIWHPGNEMADNTLPVYQNEMVGDALRGYAMDVLTNDMAPVRAYLAQQRAPSNFKLPPGLQKVELVGCAIQDWQGAKVSMICFRTGRPLAPGSPADLWLVVADRSLVKNAPAGATQQFTKVNRLITATWSEGDKLYFLGVEGDEADLKQYL